ncbi:DNA polymerase III subunit gamma/tau [Halopseudomonas salegens]|uniref:DNA polymerase III subunit gamma/tau n=1 Tax=Halopseudomonas salegens TaxID=1434072 RepID=A0A1H2EIH2_9GAMM|nr:DNA polymerase III subunit gamma/tau [Halopseudomonas salegens]SDT94942.1 DNA polymerase III, gamma subunit /DNA polymerase III, tau subunit [Halopseudomonas salegens]
MSYQVLARKWRPRLFREMVGQTHVLQALINALDNNRLHHAYLFTGTRGVGKTTIARILAKCLNCEQGVSSEPCGVCSACREIDEGRFVDLIEVDAASRTKVEDTRELLDNVQYAPSRGRFKVYLIDEVHMLSGHSFNALLKTLEEPPEHVKFLLATTDPQKLPVTILSRCLQFSLKNMTPDKMVDHLRHVLSDEQIPHDDESLWLLGRAADGSMRDALSLTDQAIAFGNGHLEVSQVRTMLGTIDHTQVFALLDTLAADDARAMLTLVAELAEQGADFAGVLAELITSLQRIALAQVVPEAADAGQGDAARVLELARSISAEDVQLFYQLALHGRRDLPLAPEPRGGFEMTLLRMLAFRPGTLGEPDSAPPDPAGKPARSSQARADSAVAGAPAAVPSVAATPAAAKELASPAGEPATPSSGVAAPAQAAESVAAAAVAEDQAAETGEAADSAGMEPAKATAPQPLNAATPVKPPQDEPPADWLQAAPDEPADERADYDDEAELAEYQGDWTPAAEPEATGADAISDLPLATGLAAEWLALFPRLALSGLTLSIAAHCQWVRQEGNQWLLHLDPSNSALYNDNHRQRLQQAISDCTGEAVELMVEVAAPTEETPAIAEARRRHQRQCEAEATIKADPLVQALISEFSARICDDSIRPQDIPAN